MAGGACSEEARGGCALHLRTFGRAEALDLAAPPPRPNLLSHANGKWSTLDQPVRDYQTSGAYDQETKPALIW